MRRIEDEARRREQMVAKIKRLREIPLAKEAAEREAGRRDETEQTQLLARLAISAKQCGDVGETLFWGLGPASMSRVPLRCRDESGYASIIEIAQLTPCRATWTCRPCRSTRASWTSRASWTTGRNKSLHTRSHHASEGRLQA